jgi:hypothetical protein
MMRIFLTRLPNFATRTVLPVSCLLLCLACRTTFPFEKLEQSMTPAEVRAVAGEPEATTGPTVVEQPPKKPSVEVKAWTYTHDQWDPFTIAKPMFILLPVMFPVAVLMSPFVNDVVPSLLHEVFFIKWDVVLYFEDEKLAWWTVPGGSLEIPQFRRCINQCTTNHNACVAEATNADWLESCSTEIRSCASRCDKDHGLYIEGAGGIDRADDAPSLAEAAAR